MQFVDLDDLARFSLTCKKAKNELANDIIWKKHFDRTYTKFAVMTQSNSYFDRCKSAYINKKKLGSNLSQYERDWIMGWRVIVIEEFLSSICSMPHLLVLPAKLLGYGLVPLKSKFIDWVNKLNLNSLFYTKFMEVSAGAPEWYPGYEEIIKQNANNFWRKHNVGIDAFFYFSKAMISYGSYYYTSIIYWFYYLFSGGEMHPVNKDPVRYYNGVRITRVLAYNPGYGIIQLISLPIYLLLMIFPFAFLPYCQYKGYLALLFKLTTIKVLLYIYVYLCALNICATSLCLLANFPLYRPHKSKLIT
jgi:hypothetical protein